MAAAVLACGLGSAGETAAAAPSLRQIAERSVVAVHSEDSLRTGVAFGDRGLVVIPNPGANARLIMSDGRSAAADERGSSGQVAVVEAGSLPLRSLRAQAPSGEAFSAYVLNAAVGYRRSSATRMRVRRTGQGPQIRLTKTPPKGSAGAPVVTRSGALIGVMGEGRSLISAATLRAAVREAREEDSGLNLVLVGTLAGGLVLLAGIGIALFWRRRASAPDAAPQDAAPLVVRRTPESVQDEPDFEVVLRGRDES